MSTFDSVQDRDLLPVYTVKSRNKAISANTNKLKSSNSLCHRAKPNHLEADAATGSRTCDNQRPVGRLDADTSWSETLFLRYSSVTKRLIRLFFSMLGVRAGMTVWCTLIHWHWDWCIWPTACSGQKLDLEKVPHEKGKVRDLSRQLDPGNVNQCFMRALISVDSITGLDNISAFFGKRKWNAVQLLQPVEGTS